MIAAASNKRFLTQKYQSFLKCIVPPSEIQKNVGNRLKLCTFWVNKYQSSRAGSSLGLNCFKKFIDFVNDL